MNATRQKQQTVSCYESAMFDAKTSVENILAAKPLIIKQPSILSTAKG